MAGPHDNGEATTAPASSHARWGGLVDDAPDGLALVNAQGGSPRSTGPSRTGGQSSTSPLGGGVST